MDIFDAYDVTFAIKTVALGSINIIVILGNILVILAVAISRKLRTVTNHFIVSLAMADLLLGLSVLPFSATLEVLSYWVFGNTWCVVWLAVDVLICTASILNLCAISLDRYIAITRPMTYNSIMSPCKAKTLIAAVWIVAFVISFPPLVGWNERHTNANSGEMLTGGHSDFNFTFNDSSEMDMWLLIHGLRNQSEGSYNTQENLTETWLQTLSQDEFYPMASGDNVVDVINETCGGLYVSNSSALQCTLTSEPSYIVYSALGSFFIPSCIMLFLYWRIYREACEAHMSNKRGYKLTKGSNAASQDEALRSSMVLRIHRGNSTRTKPYHMTSSFNNGYSCRPTHYCKNRRKPKERLNCLFRKNPHGVSNGSTLERTRRKSSTRLAEHLKRLHKETRAAKTLAIIVGAFICCWMPFFTVYLLGAFCPNCTPGIVFKIFFWLGYCNSAVNPAIYAMFSKDFRGAFKEIIWYCCSRRKNIPATVNMARRWTVRESISFSSAETSLSFQRLPSHGSRSFVDGAGVDDDDVVVDDDDDNHDGNDNDDDDNDDYDDDVKTMEEEEHMVMVLVTVIGITLNGNVGFDSRRIQCHRQTQKKKPENHSKHYLQYNTVDMFESWTPSCHTDVGNYRPISVLPILSKEMESIVSNQLINYLDKYDILIRTQFGFRKKHSTKLALTDIADKLDKGYLTFGIFIDLRKAFDTINHNILIEKLNHYVIRGKSAIGVMQICSQSTRIR
ncbi:putative G-protein coupled receptor No9 [Glandiceps talaboti]